MWPQMQNCSGRAWTSENDLTMILFRKNKIKHILNVGTGIDTIRDDKEIVEKKIELMDIPEHNLDEGDAYSISAYSVCLNIMDS